MALAAEPYCYLTTTGRVSGQPREIEVWFALDGDTAYLLSAGGDRSDWVRNIRREPAVSLRIADQTFAATARFPDDPEEDERARALVTAKYGREDSDWRRTGLPVAIDLDRSARTG